MWIAKCYVIKQLSPRNDDDVYQSEISCKLINQNIVVPQINEYFNDISKLTVVQRDKVSELCSNNYGPNCTLCIAAYRLHFYAHYLLEHKLSPHVILFLPCKEPK